jgi:hypothetical protein
MKNKKILVTSEDIERAHSDINYSDPIEVAIERYGHPKAIVNSAGASFGGFRMTFPKGLDGRLKEWNLTRRMEPFELEAECNY